MSPGSKKILKHCISNSKVININTTTEERLLTQGSIYKQKKIISHNSNIISSKTNKIEKSKCKIASQIQSSNKAKFSQLYRKGQDYETMIKSILNKRHYQDKFHDSQLFYQSKANKSTDTKSVENLINNCNNPDEIVEFLSEQLIGYLKSGINQKIINCSNIDSIPTLKCNTSISTKKSNQKMNFRNLMNNFKSEKLEYGQKLSYDNEYL